MSIHLNLYNPKSNETIKMIRSTTQLPYSLAETIRQKKSQYCRFADTQDWDSFRDLFADNASIVFSDANGITLKENKIPLSFPTPDEFVDHFAVAFSRQQTIHQTGPGELSFVEGKQDEVNAIWPVMYKCGSKSSFGGWSGNGGGHYHEVWKEVDGEWCIQSLRFVRTYWKVTMGRLD
ncbi:hypothetical protein BDV18DRAFT_148206 [Aspergillus unguis]